MIIQETVGVGRLLLFLATHLRWEIKKTVGVGVVNTIEETVGVESVRFSPLRPLAPEHAFTAPAPEHAFTAPTARILSRSIPPPGAVCYVYN